MTRTAIRTLPSTAVAFLVALALAATAVLLAMHSLFSWAALHWQGLGGLIKGHDQLLIRDGKIDKREMRSAHMT